MQAMIERDRRYKLGTAPLAGDTRRP